MLPVVQPKDVVLLLVVVDPGTALIEIAGFNGKTGGRDSIHL